MDNSGNRRLSFSQGRSSGSSAENPQVVQSDASVGVSEMQSCGMVRSNQLVVQQLQVEALKLPARQLRQHPERQLAHLAASIDQFGFNVPILVGPDRQVIVGVGRIAAARRLGLATVPAIEITHLSPAQIRAFRIAENRLAELSSWDDAVLAVELKDLADLNLEFDLEITGFATAEIDIVIDRAGKADEADPVDDVPPPEATAITQVGDIWQLGSHRLICGDALEAETYQQLMAGEKARLVQSDPPYNVAVSGHVSGLGRARHREFAMASGEMTESQFTAFLQGALQQFSANLVDGGLLHIFMDGQHHFELGAAYRNAGLRLLNVCTWAKTNAGMGSLYRSQTELVFILKSGTAPHLNNVQLGRFGAYRTTLWTYAGQNTFHAQRTEELGSHPTVKPVALVADAIRDSTRRDDIVLDGFAGSGTVLLAAERTGRRARAIELDPIYCDVAIRRWQAKTGRKAVHADLGIDFDGVAMRRRSAPSEAAAPGAAAATGPAPPARSLAPITRVRRRPAGA